MAVKKNSFTLVELMIVSLLFVFIIGGTLAVLSVGRISWQQTEVSVELQQDLRKAMLRITKELRESGFDSAPSPMFTIEDNTGVNSTDIVRFSIPVDYDNDGDITDAAGDIEWGGVTLWANKDPDCEAPGDNCQELDYEIEYLINAENQFIRRVLDNTSAVVREDNYANNILDFQVSLKSGYTDIVNIEITVQKDTVFGRTITKSLISEIYLRSQG